MTTTAKKSQIPLDSITHISAVLGGFCATTATSICVENRCAQPRDPTWALLAFWDNWASMGQLNQWFRKATLWRAVGCQCRRRGLRERFGC
jgi:hypothetical protein